MNIRHRVGGMTGVMTTALVLAMAAPAQAQTGHVLPSAGATNMSFGGASTAAPVDAAGALQWNPATIGEVAEVEFTLGMELFVPKTEIASSVPTQTGGTFAGSTQSDFGVSPIPTFGIVHRPRNARWAVGVGAIGIGGFGVDYPADPNNPITMPQAGRTGQPVGGFGSIYSSYQLLQLSPAFAYKLSDWLWVGGGPAITWASLSVSPFPAAPPDSSTSVYNSASHAATSFGGGFQVGMYAPLDFGLGIGASYKSTQWFGSFDFNAENDLGEARTLTFDLDYPAITSFGLSYSGLDRFLFAADARYIQFADTDGFQEAGFGEQYQVTGFGWKNAWLFAAGAQYVALDWLTLRIGDSWNSQVIDNQDSFFNVAAPGIIQHQIYGGASFGVGDHFVLTLAARHGFENSIADPMYMPTGTGEQVMAGTEVKSTLSTTSVALNLAWRLGARK